MFRRLRNPEADRMGIELSRSRQDEAPAALRRPRPERLGSSRALPILGIAILFQTVLLPAAAQTESAKLSPDQPYQARKTNPVTYDVDFSVVVTPPYKCQVLKVWLPLPQSDAGQEVTEDELTSFPRAVQPRISTEKVYGNKFAYFEFDKPEGAQIVKHHFRVKVWELHWDLDPAQVQPPNTWPATFDPFLRGEQQAVVVNDRVKKTASEIVPKSQNPAQDIRAVMTWVNQRMKYDHVVASLQASSEHALEKSRGHCSDYHGLCASLGRALGYPTRMTYGINPFPKNSPSHCKMEAFLPPYGWVSFDVSETQRLVHEIQGAAQLNAADKDRLVQAANDRLFRGFRDNTWFLQTWGSDYDLAPPAAKRAPVVRTIYAEADGVALPEPDPANKEQKEFAWMTIHQYKADQKVEYPFKGWKSLRK